MAKNAFQVHEAFASLMGLSDRVVWDFYSPRQILLFEEKLDEIIGLHYETNRELKVAKCQIRDTLLRQVKLQTKYTNKNLLASFILVTVAAGTRHQEAKDATKFSLHFIVRTRKCINNYNSTNCCMTFIDEAGNVYNNWKHFMQSNTLPRGIALAPANGYYTFENGQLNIDSWITPWITPSVVWNSILRVVTIPIPTIPSNSIITETVVNEMTISSVLPCVGAGMNLIFDIKKYPGDVNTRLLIPVKTAQSLLKFTHSIHNFRLALKIEKLDLKEVNTLQRAALKKLFKEEDQTDQIRLLNEIPDTPFLNQYFYANETVFIADMNGSIKSISIKYKSRRGPFGIIILPTTVRYILPQKNRTLLNLTSTHPLTKHAFSEESRELTEYLMTEFNYNSLFIINEDCLQDCVQYLINYLDEATAQLLIEKARDFMKNFKGVIEKSTKLKLCAELVLWDLYKQCEEHISILTVVNIEKEMPTLFDELFFYYERMACSSNSVQRIKCNDCNGFYQEHPIE